MVSCGLDPYAYLRSTDPHEQAAVDAIVTRGLQHDKKRLEHLAALIAERLGA